MAYSGRIWGRGISEGRAFHEQMKVRSAARVGKDVVA